MTTPNKLVVDFENAKETPGTFKFLEITPKGQPPVSGSMYLKKYVVEQLGNPNKIRITVEAL